MTSMKFKDFYCVCSGHAKTVKVTNLTKFTQKQMKTIITMRKEVLVFFEEAVSQTVSETIKSESMCLWLVSAAVIKH